MDFGVFCFYFGKDGRLGAIIFQVCGLSWVVRPQEW